MEKFAVATERVSGYIGYLVMYSVSARYIKKNTFDVAFARSKLPADLKPEPPRKIDAYKFTMKLVKEKWDDKKIYEDENIYTRVLIRPLKGNEYKIVLEDVSKATGKKLSYKECIYIRVKGDRKDFTFYTNWLQCPHREALEELDKRIKELYGDILNSYIGTDLRQVVYDALTQSMAIKIRQNGAVYFIPVKYENIVEGLAKLFEELRENGYRVEFRYFPVINQPKYRNQILDKLYEEMQDVIKTAKQEYNNLYEKYNGNIPPSLRARIVKKLQNALQITKHYEENLSAQTDMYKKALEEFINIALMGKSFS